MISLLAALSLLGTAGADLPTAHDTEAAGAPVRLWMNQDRVYREGQAARLQVDTDVDGYLLVLNYDTDGRVRVLFPLDPRDDAVVHAGRRYEVRDEDGHQAFIASGDGTGLIYAAISTEPWRFEDIILNGHWDVARIEIDRRSRNPEQDLTEVVQRIAGPKGFDYDVMGYRVYGDRSYTAEAYPRGPTYIYDDGLYCNNWYWRYDGCRRWPYDGGFSFGTSIYFGGYSPFFYDPFYYGFYGYRPYGYGYGFGYGTGYYPYLPIGPYRPVRPGSVIVGRSRGYTIRPLVPAHSVVPVGTGSVTAGPARGGGQVITPPNTWRGRGPADRPSSEVTPRGPSRNAGSFEAPPARRARPENLSYPAPGGRGYGPSERESGSREAPPRVERSGRDFAPPRVERSGGGAPPARGEPSHAAPPPRAESGGHGGGGGGGGHGGGGGNHGGGGGRSRKP